jgi:hypothetical protein
MAKFKDLIIGTKIVSAGKRRKCYHSSTHKIEKGNVCLEVKEGMAWKGYCIECAASMLAEARKKLEALLHSLNLE